MRSILDAPTIQEALHGSGKVTIPQGDFHFAASLLLPDGLILMGEGETSRMVFTGNGTAMRTEIGARVHLADFHLYSESQEAQNGIHFDGTYFSTATRVTIRGDRNLTFTDCGWLIGSDVTVNASKRVVLRDCMAQRCGGHGLRIGFDSDVELEAGRFQANNGYGVYAPSPTGRTTGIRAYSTVIEGNWAGQLSGDSLYASCFIGCHFENGKNNDTVPVVFGNGAGACKGVTMIDCSMTGGNAPYCIKTQPAGIHEALTITGCCMMLSPAGLAKAHIRIHRTKGALIQNNSLYYPEIALVELGSANEQIRIEDIYGDSGMVSSMERQTRESHMLTLSIPSRGGYLVGTDRG